MRRGEWERFDRVAVSAMLRLVGAALIACAVADGWAGVWRVHGGELFPWRHLPGIPLYGRAGLVVECAIDLVAGLALVSGRARVRGLALALWLGVVGTTLGLSQRFSNHRALLLIVLVFVALAPPDLHAADDTDFAARDRPNLALVRAQLLVVYAFSVIHKLTHGFTSGTSLASLFAWPLAIARPAALGVVIAEIAVPVLLVVRPRVGLGAAVLLHGAMAVLLPSVAPFSLVMVAMATTFVSAARPSTAPGSPRPAPAP